MSLFFVYTQAIVSDKKGYKNKSIWTLRLQTAACDIICGLCLYRILAVNKISF